MLVRELKLLCTFHCDCLVELEGAFMDNDEGSSGDCTVTLELEFMDRGSLSDLTGGQRQFLHDDVDDGNARQDWDLLSPSKNNCASPHPTKANARVSTSPSTSITSPLFRNLLSPPTTDKHAKLGTRICHSRHRLPNTTGIELPPDLIIGSWCGLFALSLML